MTDIVEGLLTMADDMLEPYRRVTLDAAAEIKRLRATLKDLRERSAEESIQHFVRRIDAVLGRKP